MANLTETSNFDTGVYQLEITDPVDAGTGGNGVSNAQAKNLANRTRWLKDNMVAKAGGADGVMTGNLAILTGAAGRQALDIVGKMILRDATASKSSILISQNATASPNGDSGSIMFARTDNANVIGPSIQGLANATPANGRRDLVFWQHKAADYTTLYEAMRLTADGQLVINTADLTTWAGASNLIVGSDTTSYPHIVIRGNVETDQAFLDLGAGSQRHGAVAGVSGGLRFYTNSSPNSGSVAFAMVITNAQRVGIGTSAPAKMLDVSGDGRFSGLLTVELGTGQGSPGAPGSESLRMMNNAAAGDDNFVTLVAGSSGVAGYCLGDSGNAVDGIVKYDNAARELSLWAANDGTGAAGNKLIIGGGGVRRATHPPVDDYSLQVATTQWIRDNLVQAGKVEMYAGPTAPAGYLECNGAAVSRTTYARLFAAIGTTWGAGNGSTTFNVPDMRGEFPRGWDHGRGVDPGRALGTYQADSFKAHQHAIPHDADGSAANRHLYGTVSLGATPIATLDNKNANVTDAPLTSDGGGGTETRPRNAAVMFIIKT